MITLVLSIISSTLIFVIFKLFRRFEIDTFQAIVVNYVTACGLGFALYHPEWNPAVLEDFQWLPMALLCAVFFISLFLVMGKSSQVNGVASTSVAVKMSMAVSMLLMIYVYSESINVLKIGGIILAFFGVFLVSSPDKKYKEQKQITWMLLVLFFGSGMLDFVLNYTMKFSLGALSPSLFSAIGFGIAAIIGIIILVIRVVSKKTKIQGKNLVAGLILGIPNYFSIFLLMLSYSTTGWQDSTVLAVTNVSVVVASAILGFLVFSENASSKKITGLLAALSAIIILYFASLN